RAFVKELDIEGFSDLETALAANPDFVVVATPTHLHIRHALQIARRGIDVFIEKPLSYTWDGIQELSDLIERKKLISLVGCNMRLHPGPARAKELLDRGVLGRVLCARVHVGSYLPSWHPGSDYRDNYAARPETGGVCILDCIHELDLARWYLGDVEEVFCMTSQTGSLEIETEDIAALTCRH